MLVHEPTEYGDLQLQFSPEHRSEVASGAVVTSESNFWNAVLLFAPCRCHKTGKKYDGVESGGIAGKLVFGREVPGWGLSSSGKDKNSEKP